MTIVIFLHFLNEALANTNQAGSSAKTKSFNLKSEK